MAIYVRSTLQSSVWTHSSDVETYELLWVRVEAVVIGALYHPPRPQYAVESLVDYIEACVEEVVRSFPQAVVLVGDFNLGRVQLASD